MATTVGLAVLFVILGFVLGFFSCFAAAFVLIGKVWTPDGPQKLVQVVGNEAANDDPATFDDAFRADQDNSVFVDPSRWQAAAVASAYGLPNGPRSTDQGAVTRRRSCGICAKVRNFVLKNTRRKK